MAERNIILNYVRTHTYIIEHIPRYKLKNKRKYIVHTIKLNHPLRGEDWLAVQPKASIPPHIHGKRVRAGYITYVYVRVHEYWLFQLLCLVF